MTTYRTTRRRALGLAGSLIITSLAFSAAGAQAEPSGASRAAPGLAQAQGAPQHFWDALELQPAEPQAVWSRLRDSFQWQQDLDRPRVQEWIAHYRSSPHNVVEIIERSRPWLHWITSQLEARGLPGEIALLPFVESAFDPAARNASGASGLWQFMPRTGRALGLTRGGGYDGRLDVVASTEAALDYIEQQADRWYNGDLELSLAAYNAGAGTVNRARRAAASRGEDQDYWHLRLPGETMNYVPKLLAISAIINDPERYAVELPDIEDTPAFATVEVDSALSLSKVAELAEVSPEELEALNPGLLEGSINPAYSSVVLVPSDKEEALLASLESMQPEFTEPGAGEHYVVRSGDSLSRIAARHDVSLAEIRQHNALSGDLIRAGQTLQIPQAPSLASSS